LGSDAYADGAWFDDLTLTPGLGYKLKTTSAPTIYNYPTNQLGTAVKAPASVKVNNAAPTSWIQPTNTQFTAALRAQVYKDNVLYEQDGLILAVIKDGVCRGVRNVFTTSGGKKFFNLTYTSNLSNEEGFNIKVYDPTTDVVYDAVETITFTAQQSIGTTSNPMRISFSSTAVKTIALENSFSIYPNPVKDVYQITFNSDLSANASVELYDMQGKLVQTIYNGVVNSSNVVKISRDKSISKGMYLLKAIVGDKNYTTKLILQ
jgi:hypothetical protein